MFLVLVLLASGFVAYSLEYRWRATERAIAGYKHDIREEHENMKLLRAEWSYLTQPKRLERLARNHLQMEPIEPDQYMSLEKLEQNLPNRFRAKKPIEKAIDPIGEMLKVLQ